MAHMGGSKSGGHPIAGWFTMEGNLHMQGQPLLDTLIFCYPLYVFFFELY